MAAKMKTKHYSAHNVATRVSLYMPAVEGDITIHDHYDVDRIFVGLSWELHCWIVHSSDGGQQRD